MSNAPLGLFFPPETFGKSAYDFVDFAASVGAEYWFLSGLYPEAVGASRYRCESAFALDSRLVDLYSLRDDNLITDDEIADAYSYEQRQRLLSSAYARSLCEEDAQYRRFADENKQWLDGYCLFTALCERNRSAFHEWDYAIRLRRELALALYSDELRSSVGAQSFVQYKLFSQLARLRRYANRRGVALVADMPVLLSQSGCDAWCESGVFRLDSEKRPLAVAGEPPADGNVIGSVWGNPLYDFSEGEKNCFDFFRRRISHYTRLFDGVRIVGFGGLCSFCEYPPDRSCEYKICASPTDEWLTAIRGAADGAPLFSDGRDDFTDSADNAAKRFGIMRTSYLTQAFDSGFENRNLPCNAAGTVLWGAPDEGSLCDFFAQSEARVRGMAKSYLGADGDEDIVPSLVAAALDSDAALAVFTPEDIKVKSSL